MQKPKRPLSQLLLFWTRFKNHSRQPFGSAAGFRRSKNVPCGIQHRSAERPIAILGIRESVNNGGSPFAADLAQFKQVPVVLARGSHAVEISVSIHGQTGQSSVGECIKRLLRPHAIGILLEFENRPTGTTSLAAVSRRAKEVAVFAE